VRERVPRAAVRRHHQLRQPAQFSDQRPFRQFSVRENERTHGTSKPWPRHTRTGGRVTFETPGR